MKKFLVVGDPHIRVEDIEEGERLVEQIDGVAREQRPDHIVLMGDLFHTHSLVHVEVLHFWRAAVSRLASLAPVTILLGNHDAPHDMPPGIHALAALESMDVLIVDRVWPCGRSNQFLFLPFMRSNEEFIAACRAHPDANTVYCHQEFNGATYDNGFYAKHGVDPEAIPQKLVISGHIHTQQEFGKVWYVGAPRWMTVSDANQNRCIWIIEHAEDGSVVSRTPFSTDVACSKIVKLEDTPDSPADPAVLDASWRVVVDVRGPAAWVEERKALWRGRARVRTFVEGERKVAVRESEGVETAFAKFVKNYEPVYGTAKERLDQMVHDRLQIAVSYAREVVAHADLEREKARVKALGLPENVTPVRPEEAALNVNL